MHILTHLSNTLPYAVVLFVCGHTGIHLCPTQQGKMASQIFINITVHLLMREVENKSQFSVVQFVGDCIDTFEAPIEPSIPYPPS